MPGSQQSLDIQDADARMFGHGARAGQTFGKRRHPFFGLQWILRRHQPPHLIQSKAGEGEKRDVTMAGMGRVEGATQQSHPPGRSAAERRGGVRSEAQGRT